MRTTSASAPHWHQEDPDLFLGDKGLRNQDKSKKEPNIDPLQLCPKPSFLLAGAVLLRAGHCVSWGRSCSELTLFFPEFKVACVFLPEFCHKSLERVVRSYSNIQSRCICYL